MRVEEWSDPDVTAELVSAKAGVTLVGHSHDTAHAMLMLDGHLSDDGRAYGPGALRLSPAGDRHFVRFHSTSTCLVIAAAPAAMRLDVRDRWSGSIGPVSLRALRRVSCPATRGEWEGLVASALAAIDGTRAGIAGAPSWLSELRRHVSSGRGRGASVARLARTAGVSREHLSRSFQRHFGTSFTAFKRHQRVALACEMLRTSARPLADVAGECHFADQSHMTRAFVACLGVTPASYRAAAGVRGTSQTFKPQPTPIVRLNA